MFIYVITNDVNDKAYVGLYSGKDLRARWSRHRWDVCNESRIPLHGAMRKHGVEKFCIISVWSGQTSRPNLAKLERYYIKCFGTKSPKGYNLTEGGEGSIGFKHSEETKRLLSNRIVSQETRHKMSLFHRGKVISQRQRESVAVKMRGNKHLLGHFPSQETRAKISAAGKGRKVSPDTLRKMSASAKAWHQKSSEVNNQSRREGQKP